MKTTGPDLPSLENKVAAGCPIGGWWNHISLLAKNEISSLVCGAEWSKMQATLPSLAHSLSLGPSGEIRYPVNMIKWVPTAPLAMCSHIMVLCASSFSAALLVLALLLVDRLSQAVKCLRRVASSHGHLGI
jgi:hypothetical protein